jgi:hypothetical protein
LEVIVRNSEIASIDGITNRTAGATAVVGLAPVNHPEVVRHAQPIEFDTCVSASGCWNLKVLLDTGSPWRECLKGVHAAAIGRELCYLLRVNQKTLLTGIRLYRRWGCLHRYRLLRRADLELKVNSSAIPHV